MSDVMEKLAMFCRLFVHRGDDGSQRQLLIAGSVELVGN